MMFRILSLCALFSAVAAAATEDFKVSTAPIPVNIKVFDYRKKMIAQFNETMHAEKTLKEAFSARAYSMLASGQGGDPEFLKDVYFYVQTVCPTPKKMKVEFLLRNNPDSTLPKAYWMQGFRLVGCGSSPAMENSCSSFESIEDGFKVKRLYSEGTFNGFLWSCPKALEEYVKGAQAQPPQPESRTSTHPIL